MGRSAVSNHTYAIGVQALLRAGVDLDTAIERTLMCMDRGTGRHAEVRAHLLNLTTATLLAVDTWFACPLCGRRIHVLGDGRGLSVTCRGCRWAGFGERTEPALK